MSVPFPEIQAIRRSRTWPQEVELILSAMDCALNGERALYVSSELTTGRRYYQLLAEHGVSTSDELRQALGPAGWRQQLWDPNAEAANDFAAALRRQQPQALVMTPAPFVAPEWSQPEYLGFWDRVIRSRVRAVYFNEGWQYSNGCTYELTVALEAELPTFDATGARLDGETALRHVEQAQQELSSLGFQPTGLTESRERLHHLLQAA